MNRSSVIALRELRSFFFSPIAYVIAFFFVLIRGYEAYSLTRMFSIQGRNMTEFPVTYCTTNGALLMCVLVPAILTMRLFSEEKRTGSMELLLTAPVTDLEVVMGKWISALVFYAALWIPSLVLLFVMQSSWLLDISLPLGLIFTVHLWVLLAGGLFLAIGLFCSSLTQNQLVASLSGIVLIYILFFGPYLMVMTQRAPKDGIELELFEQVFILNHVISSFGKGLLDLSQIWFYLSATAAVLFLTVRSVEARKWV